MAKAKTEEEMRVALSREAFLRAMEDANTDDEFAAMVNTFLDLYQAEKPAPSGYPLGSCFTRESGVPPLGTNGE
jgi:hypothetical protein